MEFHYLNATFGRLEQQELHLHPGLNLICAPNESGKSTWSAFIRTMLYGLSTRDRGPLADKNRYAPWSGAAMQGRMDLLADGRAYTLLRDTRRAASPMGGFSCTYTGTATPVEGLTALNAGEQLLGVPREVFERSAFIGQNALAVQHDTELERRISALITTGEEDASYTESYERLKKQLNRRRSNRTTGQIPVLEREIGQLQETLREVDALQQQARQAQEETDALERRVAALQRQAAQQRAQQRQERINTYRDAAQAAEDAQRRADALAHAADALPEDAALALLEGQAAALPPELSSLAEKRRAAEDARTHAGLTLTLAAARGADQTAAAAALKTADECLTAAYATLGLGPEGFVPHYTCPTCKDTGMVNGRPCSCVAEAARTLRREEINAASPLALCSFDTFELDRYPAEPEPELGGTPRDYMGKVLAYCQRYANSFTPESRGLMFIGSAGLGKTHMALAIADTVLNRGFDVLYTSSAALAAQLGREHFDRAAEDPWLDACKEADLLILDDLGTEYISQLTISVLYELINTRMLCHRPTIYTSNIVDSSIFEARYTEKVASRILGSCQIFKFFGTDQRLKRGGKR